MSVFTIILSLVIVLSLLSIVWSTIAVGISPMPSNAKAYRALLQLLELCGENQERPIVDLGSGWGNLVIRLAKQYPQRKIIGYEISLLPWLCCTLLKSLLKLDNLEIRRINFLKTDLPSAVIMLCYLHPDIMSSLSQKIQAQQNKPHALISNNFALPFYRAEQTLQLDDFYRSPVYLYRFVE